jgi:hydroxypyruvate isomerase
MPPPVPPRSWRCFTPKIAANLSMLFTEVPFLERFEAAAAEGLEDRPPQPQDTSVDSLQGCPW